MLFRSEIAAFQSELDSEHVEARLLAIFRRWGNDTTVIETTDLQELADFVFDNLTFPEEGAPPDEAQKLEILKVFPFATRASVLNKQESTYCCLSVARGNVWDPETSQWVWTGKKYGNQYPKNNALSTFTDYFSEKGILPESQVSSLTRDDLIITLYGHRPYVDTGFIDSIPIDHFSVHRADSLFARHKLGFGGSDVLIPFKDSYQGSPEYGSAILALVQKAEV